MPFITKDVLQNQKQRLYLFLAIVLFLMLAFILFISLVGKPVAENKTDLQTAKTKARPAEKADTAKLENDYKNSVKPIFSQCLSVVSAEAKLEDVEKAKNNLLALRVPAKFKDLHVSMFLALVKMENYLQNHDLNEVSAAAKMIGEAQAGNSWLN